MDDLISRQAVMDCFKKWQPYMATRLWDFEQELSALPSVNPQPCEDAISRQAVLEGIEELKRSPWATDKRGNGFEYLITEALDVVADLCVKQEPSVKPQICEDMISRQDAIKAIKEKAKRIKNEDTLYGLAGAVGILFDLPSVKPQPKTGHWKIANSFCTCDQCGYKTRPWNNTLFCPNCGAKMVEEQEGANE